MIIRSDFRWQKDGLSFRKREILRRPMCPCQSRIGIIGLLRMTKEENIRQSVGLGMKDSSSTDVSMPTNNRNYWPPQNDNGGDTCQPVGLGMEDSSSADVSVPTNNRYSWPPQNNIESNQNKILWMETTVASVLI